MARLAGEVARPIGVERADAINIRIPIEGAGALTVGEIARSRVKRTESGLLADPRTQPGVSRRLNPGVSGEHSHQSHPHYRIRLLANRIPNGRLQRANAVVIVLAYIAVQDGHHKFEEEQAPLFGDIDVK
jgi:hypothetical protein